MFCDLVDIYKYNKNIFFKIEAARKATFKKWKIVSYANCHEFQKEHSCPYFKLERGVDLSIAKKAKVSKTLAWGEGCP